MLSGSSNETEKAWVCNVNRVTCEWKITSAELLSKGTGQAILSPVFHTGDGKEQWRVKFFPRGQNLKSVNSISYYLMLQSSERLGILAKFKLSIKRLENIIAENSCIQKYDRLESWGWQNFVKQSKLFSPDCSDIIITITLNTSTAMSKEQLSTDFRCLFEDPKFSDVTIVVEDDKLPAHKSVLSVRSSVFAAMFTHEEMDENRKKEVKIEDLEPAVVKGMLEYIYTGEVAEIKVLAKGLLAAAEKYDLEPLKAVCEENLCKNVEVNNAAEILMQANLYRATGLKEFTMKFIKDNLHDVIQTDAYKEITDHILLKEIISFNVQKRVNHNFVLIPPLSMSSFHI